MRQLFIILTLITGLCSCETYFVPDIDDQEKLYVFEGLLTNEAKVHHVQIKQSVAFDSDDYFEYAGGFTVTIETASGEIIPLNEVKDGYHSTDSTVVGKIGESYRVVATSAEGVVYQSEFELLSEGAEIKDIDAEYKEDKILRYNEYAGYTEELINGLQVLVDVDAKSFSPYYRYEFDMVIQSQQIYPGGTGPILMYVAYEKSSKYMDLISVLNSNQYVDNKIVKGPVAYIPEDFMGDRKIIGWELDSLGRQIFKESLITHRRAGFLLEVHQYSLSEKGFSYWESIHDQTNSTGQIFDPVQAQIVGNMTCRTNEEEIVFGYFGASAVTKDSRFMKYVYPNTAKVEPVVYFPQLDTVTWSNAPFDWWVY